MIDGLLSNGLERGIVCGHPTHHDSQTWVVRCVKPCRGDEYIHRHPTVKGRRKWREGGSVNKVFYAHFSGRFVPSQPT